jgi:S1-C subfamily serine protease
VRTWPLAAVAVACALLGGAAALALGKVTGWVDQNHTTTVFRAAPVPGFSSAAPVAAGALGKPLSGNGFDPARIFARRSRGAVTIFAVYGSADSSTSQAAQGSGFVVSPQGYILTGSHVITTAGNTSTPKPADSVFVEFKDHDRVAAKIVGWDVYDDVGLLKVDPSVHRLTTVPLGDSAAVAVGEPVAAIGSPFGNVNSLAVGVVSATRRSISSLTSTYNLVDAIQIDAPINHGNSGGPLFDARGRVIGINVQIRSNSGTAEGVGFAVPINSARRSMQQLIAKGSVSYAFVGIKTEDLTPSLAQRFGYPVEQGAVIESVEPKTPGQAAGLKGGGSEKRVLGTTFTVGGDLIVAIDGRPVRSSLDVVRIVTEALAPGELARFTIYRGDSRREVKVRLSERPSATG